jgi:hypothetical protein
MTSDKSIHTLNARDHVMLEVMRDHFGLTPTQMFREISALRDAVEVQLALKGIAYEKLKSALVPDRKRKEIALVFDTRAIASNWYGLDVFERLIPLFDKTSNHSILVGDYLDRSGQEAALLHAMQQAVHLIRDVEYHHPTQFYIVYINNLTDAMIETFHTGLKQYPGYVGFADTTYSSNFKIFLSTMLVNLGIKHGRIVIQGHEPDRDKNEDVNTCGYPFESAGYLCRSLSSDLMGVLLSYKIERPVFDGFEVDTEFSLNAISTTPLLLDDFDIEVTEAKLAYIKDAKAGSAERAGIDAMSVDDLAELIKRKVAANYIYNLGFNAIHNVAKFNIMIELPSQAQEHLTRLLAALEYQPNKSTLRLITLY